MLLPDAPLIRDPNARTDMSETPETPETPGKPELPKLDFAPLEAAFQDVGKALAGIVEGIAAFADTVRAAGHLVPCARTGCQHPRMHHLGGSCVGKNRHCACIGFQEPAPPDSL